MCRLAESVRSKKGTNGRAEANEGSKILRVQSRETQEEEEEEEEEEKQKEMKREMMVQVRRVVFLACFVRFSLANEGMELDIDQRVRGSTLGGSRSSLSRRSKTPHLLLAVTKPAGVNEESFMQAVLTKDVARDLDQHIKDQSYGGQSALKRNV